MLRSTELQRRHDVIATLKELGFVDRLSEAIGHHVICWRKEHLRLVPHHSMRVSSAMPTGIVVEPQAELLAKFDEVA